MRKTINLDKSELQDLYCNRKESIRDIAKMKGCGFTTIRRYLKHFNIPRRTKSEAMLCFLKDHESPHWKGDKIPRRDSKLPFTGMERLRLGLAGEFRVMSELLLRGHNPSKSYLQDGADLTLENSLRLEVKSSHRYADKRGTYYMCNLKGGHRKQRQQLDSFDFLILWCVDDDVFYIIPKAEVILTPSGTIAFTTTSENARHRYAQYRERWDLLNKEVIQ